MKLYMHPISTTCRPVMFFIADHGLDVEQEVVDIMTGKQFEPAFVAINPNCAVPVLEDGGFRLTESSAILKYLAEKIASPAYPSNLQDRARVNEVMDWLNTGFYRSFGYGLCYGQLIDTYKNPDANGQKLAIECAQKSAARFLSILNDHIIGPERNNLCGNTMTLADYLGSGFISLGEVIGCTFADYPNIMRWYGAMKRRPNWQAANGGVYGWADYARGPDYVRV